MTGHPRTTSQQAKRFSRSLAALCLLAPVVLSGCSREGAERPSPPRTDISIVMPQVLDLPAPGNPVEQKIEAYTGAKLRIQWIPTAAFEDKINLMIAAGDMPKLLQVDYSPTIIGAIRAGLFWEIGPYLKDYPNLSAQDPLYYRNISVNGKLYGLPNFREMGRSAVIYRKDWFDQLGLTMPTSAEEWYQVIRTLTLGDPDRNGKADTYGLMLFKRYNEGQQALTTRLSVSLGGPNKWAVTNGKFTPEFMTDPFFEVLKLFRRLYAEKLINTDFAVLDQYDTDKQFDQGKVGIRVAVAQNGKSQQDRLLPYVPTGVVDIEPMRGPSGIRLPGESGNFGFYLIPKSAVKSEAELRQVLTFMDKLMDPEMAALLLRGIEGKHYMRTGGMTEFRDFTKFQSEVKPYRDNLPSLEGYHVPPLRDTALGEKGRRIAADNAGYIVPNPALTLFSPTYAEKGQLLEDLIWDAETRFIMGKLDEAGWKAEIGHWLEAGGRKLIAEYEADYAVNR